MISLKDYKNIVGGKILNEIWELGEKLSGKRVVHINSTRIGGGVAEILRKLIPLLNEARVKAEWQVVSGNSEFFHATKNIHHALHGADLPITRRMVDSYIQTNQENARHLDLNDADFVVIHDPQPATLIEHFPNRRGRWIWRCHIDVSSPNPRVWNFLKKYISQYDAAVFHVDKFAKEDLAVKQFVIPPSLDPLSWKNRPLSRKEVNRVKEKFDLDHGKLILSQIGRFDRWKDPEGVLRVYRELKNHRVKASQRCFNGGETQETSSAEVNCQLVLAGGLAIDDPEGLDVFQDLQKMAEGDGDVHLLILPPKADVEVNALQRASDVVIQKSLKEGFGLTVSEALWKEKAVVGGNAGGITLQIIHGVTGFLVNSVEEAADYVRVLLKHPEKASNMGKRGREYVRKNFLITRLVRDHLALYLTIEHERIKSV